MFLTALFQAANATEICIAPFNTPTSKHWGIAELGEAPDKPSTISVHLIGEVVEQGNSYSECFSVAANKKIAVQIKENSRPKESFYINAEDYPEGACVWFKSSYWTWSVWPLPASSNLCTKKTDENE